MGALDVLWVLCVSCPNNNLNNITSLLLTGLLTGVSRYKVSKLITCALCAGCRIRLRLLLVVVEWIGGSPYKSPSTSPLLVTSTLLAVIVTIIDHRWVVDVT